MKTLSALLASYLTSRRRRGNLRMLVMLLLLFCVIVFGYSVLFHWIMAIEGHQHSWLTGFYWTMVSMSTLGFGDITFESDLGRMFSVIVLMTGTVFMLILLPFTFIQFFYAPWLEARDNTRAPRELPDEMNGHVLLTAHSPVDVALIERLDQFGTPYFVLVAEPADALALYDKGVKVMVGVLDDPETYRRARVHSAALVVATLSDTLNANIALTAREVSEHVPIVATAASAASVDVLELAGCQLVLRLGDLLGRTMAKRVFGRNGRSHFIGRVDDLLIAEASAAGTSLIGHTLRELRLRERFQLTVGGVWERGHYTLGGPDTPITAESMLLLAGTRDQLDAYDREFGRDNLQSPFVLIIGGGRVGRAAASSLREQGIEYRIVEKVAGRAGDDDEHVVVGDAADLEILKRGGIDKASTVIVTTREDDMNVYLTLYCRRLRPELLILARATLERNTKTLHRAGADFVLSYSAMGANAIVNLMRESTLLLVAEGLDVFKVPIPSALVGKTLIQSRLRADTGCNLLALRQHGKMIINPPADAPMPAGIDMILLGDREAERRFFERYPAESRS